MPARVYHFTLHFSDIPDYSNLSRDFTCIVLLGLCTRTDNIRVLLKETIKEFHKSLLNILFGILPVYQFIMIERTSPLFEKLTYNGLPEVFPKRASK